MKPPKLGAVVLVCALIFVFFFTILVLEHTKHTKHQVIPKKPCKQTILGPTPAFACADHHSWAKVGGKWRDMGLITGGIWVPRR